MKQDHDYLETSIWYKEEIPDPYQVIAEFFAYDDIASCRRTNKGILLAASSKKIYMKSNPGDLLFHFKMLESVINASYVINKEGKKSPLNIGPADLFNKNLFCGWYSYLTEWDYIPRSLSEKEYCDPYLVLKSFFKFQTLSAWKRDFQNISDYALVKDDLFEGGIKLNILSFYLHLTKLMEAVHLIDVRETNHIGGIVKNRVKRS